jgi:hypothetical protein
MRFKPPRQDSGASLPLRSGLHDEARLNSSRGTTGDTGRLAPLEVSLEKMDMAKAKLLEPQRVSVMLAVASPANGAMRSNTIVLSRVKGEPFAEGPGAVQNPQPRSQQVCVAYRNVNEEPKSIGQMRRQLPEKSEEMKPGPCGKALQMAESL